VSRQLDAENKIPVVRRFLQFDRGGLLRVNLITQKGNLWCVDRLTLGVAVDVGLDAVAAAYRFMRSNVAMPPLTAKEPGGFAEILTGMTDVSLFTPKV